MGFEKETQSCERGFGKKIKKLFFFFLTSTMKGEAGRKADGGVIDLELTGIKTE